MTLSDIIKPIEPYFNQFNQTLVTSLDSESSTLSQSIKLINQSTAKRVRPMLLGLCSGLCGVDPQQLAVQSAVVLELIHTSTLIHDDVIDMADSRRGQPTINAVYDNHTAVLTGDFILSRALIMAVNCMERSTVTMLLTACAQLVEGELLQIDVAKAHDYTEEKYERVIYKKTAALFELATGLGAWAAQATDDQQERCAEIGRLLGMAFQIKDDVFDYTANASTIGKPTGNDLIEGKVTLPLLYALQQADDDQQRHIKQLIEQAEETHQVDEIIQFAIHNGGIEYANRTMQSYISEAQRLLATFPPSPYRQALEQLALFITNRTK